MDSSLTLNINGKAVQVNADPAMPLRNLSADEACDQAGRRWATKNNRRVKRRALLLSAAGASGALIIGWSALPARSGLGSGKLWSADKDTADIALNGWIKIKPDGSIVLVMPRSEMGQGVHTALATLVAEWLDVPLGRVSPEQAASDVIYGKVALLVASLPFYPLETDSYSTEGAPRVKPDCVHLAQWMVAKVGRELGINATGGCSSVADAWEVLRMAAATARTSLLGAASLQWKLPRGELSTKAGVVSHVSGPSAHYGELARFASATPPGEVTLKARKD